jgi:hypothetical protein
MKTPNQINLRGLVFRGCRQHLVFMVVWLVLFQCGPIAGAAGILEAAKAGDAAGVRSILQTNAAAASVTNRWGETALHLGAGAASPAVVEALLAAKAPVNAQSQGNTALHYAISYQRTLRFAEDLGETNIQQLLGLALKSIENPEMRSVGDNATSMDKMTLRRALTPHDDPERTRAELKIAELLLAADADLKLANLGGITPLHCAAMRSEPDPDRRNAPALRRPVRESGYGKTAVLDGNVRAFCQQQLKELRGRKLDDSEPFSAAVNGSITFQTQAPLTKEESVYALDTVLG